MAYNNVRDNLSKSIAPHYSSDRDWYVDDYCTKYGLRFRALVDIPAGSEKKFVPEHWAFDDIGSGNGLDPLHSPDVPDSYTPNDLRDKINVILAWARGETTTV